MPTVLVTGASRGIGRALAMHYASAGWEVLAACRDPAQLDLPGIETVPLRVDDAASVAAMAAGLRDRPIDLLVNNAGIYGPKPSRLGSLDYTAMAEVLLVNSIGPLRVAEALLPNLRAGKRKQIATVSSRMGSIALHTSGGDYIYRSSKSAVNMAMRCLSGDLAAEGFTVIVCHPGWVQTDMGGKDATIDVPTSVGGLTRLFDGLTPSHNGRFFNYDGAELPW